LPSGNLRQLEVDLQPPNGPGAQLRGTGRWRTWVQCQMLPRIGWDTLWLISCMRRVERPTTLCLRL